MLKIKLSQTGAKHDRAYRIIVNEQRSKRDGKSIEELGYYDPKTKPATIKIHRKRLQYWLDHGAQLTTGIKNIIDEKTA